MAVAAAAVAVAVAAEVVAAAAAGDDLRRGQFERWRQYQWWQQCAIASPARAPHRPAAGRVFSPVSSTRRRCRRCIELIAARNWRNAEVIDGGLVAARGRLEQSSAPRLLIVDVDDVADPVQSLSELADISPAEMSVIAIGQYNDLSLYRDLLELGVTEYLTKPVTVATLERALLKEERRAAPRQEHKEAQIIVLLGARGGVGTTTVAAGIAWCLAEEEKQSVTLVDLDLHFGNLALSLDLVPGSGLREALEYPTRIDSRLLGSATLSKTERLRVLAAEEALIEQPQVAPGALDAVFNVLRADCDFIIIDMPRHLDDVARRVVTLATTICIVTDLSLAAARDTCVSSSGQGDVTRRTAAHHRQSRRRQSPRRGRQAPISSAPSPRRSTMSFRSTPPWRWRRPPPARRFRRRCAPARRRPRSAPSPYNLAASNRRKARADGDARCRVWLKRSA